ncbi:gliding motility-associated C-terminal domain-containing protein [Paenimyroides ummariense]|uniref:Gliding motility-associated C-terminal domain-containing protein n=1 Tax=Paenimyroides ummariense TaxID=913024 RepID=A0A1I5D399_9FLAO|nr:gliding motility-associated C-terminal domain-containing protein [Paenimyroides ummariense]SFN93331.1 gliding motility-associated C-terminal domain-containing protein [Paenimyroides ummariense]
MYKKIFLVVLLLNSILGFSQPISLYKQFYGRFDFTMVGNTLNTASNGTGQPCTILTQSSAALNLNPNQEVVAAYLYWSGFPENRNFDQTVMLNNIPITAERILLDNSIFNYPQRSAFADVTSIVQNTGNGVYLLSDFTNNFPNCASGSIYAGWAMVIIYEDPTIKTRLLNVYDGFQILDVSTISKVSIGLSNLKLSNSEGAKIGILAWETDANLAINEELRVNGNVVSDPPLNPANNVFNETDAFTNRTNVYNMDMDYFFIDNYITVGDTSLLVEVDSSSDMINFNAMVVAVTNLKPDAIISVDTIKTECDSKTVEVFYKVSNMYTLVDLPANVPIAFYLNDVLIATSKTKNIILPDQSESGFISFTIPSNINIDNDLVLTVKVDDDGVGNGMVDEVDESNNTDSEPVFLKFSPIINDPNDIVICDEGKGFVLLDLTDKYSEISTASNITITFHETNEDAEKGANRITNVTNYEIASHASKVIWTRVKDNINGCAEITFFTITAQMVPFAELKEPLMLCNLKNDPSAVNLTSVHLLLSRMFPYMNEINLKFYENEIDAENEVNEIMNITNYKPNIFPKIVWIRAKGKNNLWCDNIIPLQLNDCVVPKGISPNGDGMNDGFNIEIFNPIEVKIFNRYGLEVYHHGEGYIDQWKGQDKNNRELPSGTYFYHFRTLFDTYVGYVQLIKEIR